MGRRHNPLAVLFGTFLACLSVSAAQRQDEAAMSGDDNELPKVGESFQDCPECPLMVVVPAGTFMLGALESEAGSDEDERPVQRVAVSSFAIGVYEVTFAEWDACIKGGGCGGWRPADEGWGRGRRPVINVSWTEARLYLDWLSGRSGWRYRLPGDSEWEYAARAGTTTPFHTGSTISTDQANYRGRWSYPSGDSVPGGLERGWTIPVGSFGPNTFGLYDMHGNVWEWVGKRDCTPQFIGGGPWGYEYSCGIGRGASYDPYYSRYLRGGSWASGPGNIRSASRIWSDMDGSDWAIGFRVARELAP